MKKGLISFFLVILVFFPVVAFSATLIFISGGECQSPYLYTTMILLLGPGNGGEGTQQCYDVIGSKADALVQQPKFQGCQVYWVEYNSACTIGYAYMCCDPNIYDAEHVEIDEISSGVVSNVPVGSEKEAAEDYYDAYISGTSCPYREGYMVSDRLGGYAYTSASPDGQYADVSVDAWLRCGYTAVGGDVIPLEGIADSETQQIAGAVQQGVQDASQAIADAVQQGVENAQNQYDFSVSDSPAAPPDTSDSSQYVGYSPDDLVGTGFETRDDVSDALSSFMASNPIISVISGSSITASAGQCSFSGTVFGSTLEFSFCDLTDELSIFGMIIFTVATIYSMFILFGKG